MTTTPDAVTFIGLGQMGSALARAALAAGHHATVWNRSRSKAADLADHRVDTVTDAVEASDLLIVCLFDHRSVRDVLDPVAHRLTGRQVINLTTTSPDGPGTSRAGRLSTAPTTSTAGSWRRRT